MISIIISFCNDTMKMKIKLKICTSYIFSRSFKLVLSRIDIRREITYTQTKKTMKTMFFLVNTDDYLNVLMNNNSLGVFDGRKK